MILVVDASVALNWFLGARPDEAEAPNALDILRAAGAGRVQMVQPPHFLAEVTAVLARELPATAGEDLLHLQSRTRRPRPDSERNPRGGRLLVRGAASDGCDR